MFCEWLRRRALPFVAALYVAIAETSFPKRPATPDLAQIYDNVLSNETASWLHEECKKWKDQEKQRTDPNDPLFDKGIIIEFPLFHPEKHSPLQQFLNDLVAKLHEQDEPGKSRKYYVEYWTRQEWHHILAHQDMDEEFYRNYQKEESQRRKEFSSEKNYIKRLPSSVQDGFRHPIYGHVLYLKVGNKVQGPTVIFDAAKGSDLMKIDASKTESNTLMYSVPAVEGRLLRFPGDRLHAVPRPHDVYWTFDQSTIDVHEPKIDYQRSVLLINLWDHPDNDSEVTPTQQRRNILADKILDCADGQWIENRTTCYPLEGTNDSFWSPIQAHACHSTDVWRQIPIQHKSVELSPQGTNNDERSWLSSLVSLVFDWIFPDTITETFSVPLMGDPQKRGLRSFVANLQSSSSWSNQKSEWVNLARESLAESWAPSSVEIETDERYLPKSDL